MFCITFTSSVFVLPPEMCLVALFRPVYYVFCVTYVDYCERSGERPASRGVCVGALRPLVPVIFIILHCA